MQLFCFHMSLWSLQMVPGPMVSFLHLKCEIQTLPVAFKASKLSVLTYYAQMTLVFQLPKHPGPFLASAIFPMLFSSASISFPPTHVAGSSSAKFQLYMSLSDRAFSDHSIYERKVTCWFSNSGLFLCNAYVIFLYCFACLLSCVIFPRAGISKHFSIKGQIVDYLLSLT